MGTKTIPKNMPNRTPKSPGDMLPSMIPSVTMITTQIATPMTATAAPMNSSRPTTRATRSLKYDSRLRAANFCASARMPPRLCTASMLPTASSMALVVADPAERLVWLIRRMSLDAGNVNANTSGNVAQAIQTS